MAIVSIACILTLLINCWCATSPVSAQGAAAQAAHLYRGLLLSSKRRPEEAAAEFQKCTDLSSINGQQLRVIGQTYFDIGDTSACLKITEYGLGNETVKKDKLIQAKLLELQGNSLAATDKINESIAAFKKAAVVYPQLASEFMERAGGILVRKGRYQEALQLLGKGISPAKMNGFVYQHIGFCYLELKNPAKAIEPLKSSIAAYEAYAKRQPYAYMNAYIDSHKFLIKAYEQTSNEKEAAVWKGRLDALMKELNSDFYGK